MRDFSWKYFTLTGDVDAFLLYKEMDQLSADGLAESQAELDAAAEAAEELAP
ncbi:YqzL family protein [Paenibacillus xanthanilyticus]|uniref:YqzL family protein n=1 Tax=Paenibacillus xanthanilyticus TaxID=1783531 RepID=A0ABV8KD51_9BACL